jgi:thioesterase domain-containing protein/acyl carrier protein
MIDVEVVRQTLRRSLPVYMIPSRFVVMDALPLSPTGKVSRRHLPAPTPVAGDSHRAFVEPRNDVERAVAGIWRDVLGVERLSTDDNFFDLGGHSLLATRIVARIREELLIDLSLRTLFEFPTVAGLAKRISEEASSRFREQHGRSARRYVFPLKPVSGGKPIFFLPGGHGGDYEFLVYARLVHHVGDGFSFYGIRARSADGVETAHRSVEEMAADYIAEIRAVQPSGPYRLVGNCIGGVVAYEVARQLHRAGEEVRSLVLMDTDFPTTKRYMREIWSRVDNRWNLSYYSGRVSHHLRALRTLPPKTWGRYLFGKATAVVKDTPMLGYALDPRTSVKVGYVDTLRRYRPRRYGGSLSIIASQHDDSDPTEGWSKVVRGEIRVRSVPGDHKSYIRDFVKEAAMRLRDCLEE